MHTQASTSILKVLTRCHMIDHAIQCFDSPTQESVRMMDLRNLCDLTCGDSVQNFSLRIVHSLF